MNMQEITYLMPKKSKFVIKEDKKQWILKYMSQHKDECIDVLSENFVNAYINEFHPKIVEWYLYGAPKVHEIGMLLAELYKENKVSRYRHYCKIWRDDIQNGFIFTF